ncbi:MAG: PepSY-like domain-containing protein [Prevotella sp.]|nr:PepSY-like domain-containing protein [Prevotella sp.]
MIPEVIKQYVNENFPESIITKIEKERYGYDIELSNDLELKFNKQGYILRMDD